MPSFSIGRQWTLSHIKEVRSTSKDDHACSASSAIIERFAQTDLDDGMAAPAFAEDLNRVLNYAKIPTQRSDQYSNVEITSLSGASRARIESRSPLQVSDELKRLEYMNF
ncbi:hypothetical protein KIN20_014130 [Parelaphostrongylus tenuis]|uniref:Uncharacterized protein n=1 Tax=Parelaphostrongylus tenuis TaxID=148309 RepID=A0AAD5MHU6_PARTN|nr:hypothetical protein KIN20_014130 [Parelaphostrongylus tenuis]